MWHGSCVTGASVPCTPQAARSPVTSRTWLHFFIDRTSQQVGRAVRRIWSSPGPAREYGVRGRPRASRLRSSMVRATAGSDLRQRRRRAATIVALAGALGVFAIKGFGALLTGSTALLSDALESIVNVAASGFAFFAVRFASKPADREHPYGHGKMEHVAAAFEGGLITFAAGVI